MPMLGSVDFRRLHMVAAGWGWLWLPQSFGAEAAQAVVDPPPLATCRNRTRRVGLCFRRHGGWSLLPPCGLCMNYFFQETIGRPHIRRRR